MPFNQHDAVDIQQIPVPFIAILLNMLSYHSTIPIIIILGEEA